MDTAHVKIRIKGKKHNLDFFNYILGRLDSDWPWRQPSKQTVCPKCGGVVWKNPLVPEAYLRGAANQLKVGLKVKMFITEAQCQAVKPISGTEN